MKRLILILLGLLLISLTIAAGPIRIFAEKSIKRVSVTTEEYVPNQIVVKFKTKTSAAEIDKKIAQEGGEKVYESKYQPIKVVKTPPGKSINQLIAKFKKDPKVEYAKPNYIIKATMIPNDPLYSYQWHFYNSTYGGINMPTAWDKSQGQGVIVAVVDTGVAYENYGKYGLAPDLANTNFVPGYDFINNDTHPNDDEGHGTHVTGTIAQSTNNNLGIAGIAFSASIMPVKVLDNNGNGTYVQVADGIRYATDHGAKVINLSLGGAVPDPYLESAVQYAYNHGVTIVAATGNDGANQVDYPAAYDNYVIAVGATRFDEAVTYYSNYGSSVDITAPGGDLTVDQNGDGYVDGVLQQTFASHQPKNFGYYLYSGTSMATPHVSGVAALILARNLNFTSDQVRNFIQSTAEDHGISGWDQYYGWGIVDAAAAVPNLSISLTTDGSVSFGTLPLGSTTSTPPGSQETVKVDVGPADLTVSSTDFSDGSNHWLLSNNPGPDQVKWQYSTDNINWNTFLSPNVNYPLASNLPGGNQQDVYFKLAMPTSASDFGQHSSQVTITATSP
jgi:serine protease